MNDGIILALDGGEALCFISLVIFMIVFFVAVIQFFNKLKILVPDGQRSISKAEYLERKRKEAITKYGKPSDKSRIYRLVPELEKLDPQWDPSYEIVRIPKRSGGVRELQIPDELTKKIQYALYHKLFSYYIVHPAACGFVKGKSIVDNARQHVGQEVIVKLDIREFFPNTKKMRINRYFVTTGWTPDAADLLTKLVCYEQGLPQGAPTSPVLSNIVNKSMDDRLFSLSQSFNANYTRYADDITFSMEKYNRELVHALLQRVGVILRIYGYNLNRKKKRIIRRHRRQEVTGLVVNSKVNLSRKRRRWLRSIQHRIKTGQKLTVTMAEYRGWISLLNMVDPESNLIHLHKQLVKTDAPVLTPMSDPNDNSPTAELQGSDVDRSSRDENKTRVSSEMLDDNASELRTVDEDNPTRPSGSQDETHTADTSSTRAPLNNDQHEEQSELPELQSSPDNSGVFHEDRLEDKVQALKVAKPYSTEAKSLISEFTKSSYTIQLQLESSKRTFSFRLPEGYQKGRTVTGSLSDGTEVELYFHDSLAETVENAEFPLKSEVTIEVIQWNATFKRVEAIVTGGLFH
ncbi:MAG: hypothetical protein CMJ76_01480 [Planctomycetaceae bacterium]|nr:hypothetical protein [Planctomycetaceae bacterium]